MCCTLFDNPVEVVEVIADTKIELLNIVLNPKSSAEAAHDAFARLYTVADRDFMQAVNALCKNHPEVAKGYLAIMPERFIPKDHSFAVDGYIP